MRTITSPVAVMWMLALTAAIALNATAPAMKTTRTRKELNRKRKLWSWREELNLQPAVYKKQTKPFPRMSKALE
jgi:hypothetical protein